MFRLKDIDIYYLNINFSKRFDLLNNFPQWMLPRKGIFFGIFFFFRGFFKSILLKNRILPFSKGEILFFAPSLNNDLTLREVYKYYPDAIVISNNSIDKTYLFPKWLAYWYAIPYLPILLQQYYKADNYNKQSLATWFQMYWLTYGYYTVVEKILIKVSPKLVVLSNDHTMASRCFLHIAKHYGIKTLYIQHASVNESHPQLEFDYAFLDGKETLEEYETAGPINSNVFLTGAVRFLSGIKHNSRISNSSVFGIAYNMLDDRSNVTNLINQLLNYYPDCTIVVRPHPGDKQYSYYNEMISNNKRLVFSDSRKEKSIDFLLGINYLISNMSSIHLEAAYLGIHSVVYSILSDTKMYDPYKYLSKELVKEVNSFDDLIQIIDNYYSPSSSTISYFLADYGSSNQGKIDLVQKEIIDWILGDGSFPSKFNKKSTGKLNYYEIC